MAKLSELPKFNGPKNGPGPVSIGDWVDFWKWLWFLFLKTKASTTAAEVEAHIPQNQPSAAGQVLNTAIALQTAQQAYAARVNQTLQFLQPQEIPPPRGDLAGFILALQDPPYSKSSSGGLVLEDTHANRLASYPANSYPVGTLFWETDRTVYYLNSGALGSQNWIYTAGEFSCTQATIPADLGTHDGGFLANVFDYGHLLIWSGAAWTWGPGDAGSGMLQMFEVDPGGAGWHLYDGSTVNYLKADGTLGSIVLPNLSGAAPTRCYLKTSDTNAGPTGPTAPTFTGGAVTGLTFTGTPAVLTGAVAAPVFTGTPGTPTGAFAGAALGTHSHDSPVGSVSATIGFLTGNFGAGSSQTRAVDFTTVGGSGSAAVLKTSAVSAGTPAGTLAMDPFTPVGTNSAPALTMNSYTPAGTITGGTSAGTIGTNGEPENLTRRAFFRQ